MEQNDKTTLEFFEEMYHSTYKLVYYIINRIINNSDITEDLVQDTFVSAYRNIDSLQPKTKESFKAWVGVIASNKAKDYLKKMKPYLFSDVGSENYEYEPEDVRSELRPDEVAHSEELRLLVDKAMEDLPEDQRLVIMMFYYQQYSIKEIAQLTDITESTVKSKLHYAKSKIRVSFEKTSIQDYRYRSVSPFLLLQAGLGMVPIQSFNPGSFSGVLALSKSQIRDEKKESNRKKIGASLIIIGLAITLINGFSQPNKPTTPIDGNETVKPIEQKIDLYDYFDVSFSGENGKGKLTIVIKEANDSEISNALKMIKLNYQTGQLSNGSLVKVTIDNADQLNIDVLSYEKYYVVNGLH